MADDAQGEVKMIDFAEPMNDFERTVMEAADHAEVHLRDGYEAAMQCGLNASAAHSTGVEIAIQRVLAAHIIQHCTNMLLPQEAALTEITSVVTNLTRLINDNYQRALEDSLAFQAAQQGAKH